MKLNFIEIVQKIRILGTLKLVFLIPADENISNVKTLAENEL